MSRGFSLIELMVALVIGALAIAAALDLYAHAREIYRVNERVARLQEQGRAALSVIASDVEMAGFYGFTQSSDVIRLVTGASARELRQFPLSPGGVLPAAASPLPPGAHLCGINFAVDLSMPVQGSNNVFALGRSPTGCDAYQRRPVAGADTLTLRRVATQTSAPEAGRLQLYSSRLVSQTSGLLFADGRAPGPVDVDHHVRNVVVRTYYLARDSVGQRNFPALRVKALTRSGASLAFDEDEVMAGVEDLQVQFGIAAPGSTSGRAVRYVEPDFADLPWTQIVSARLWLRVRADAPERDFVDARTYRYADVTYTPSGVDRHYRRVLITRTLTRRNARAT